MTIGFSRKNVADDQQLSILSRNLTSHAFNIDTKHFIDSVN